MPLASQTTVTVLTPPGRGAVATIAIEGPAAVDLAARHFTAVSQKPLANIPVRRIALGTWRSGSGAAEELIVCRLAENLVEVHCHGGQAAVNAIVASLESLGAARLSPEEWASANEPDAIAAEARLALAAATTERTALILLDQYGGALRRAIAAIRAQVVAGKLSEAAAGCERLVALAPLGRHLTSPWRVVLAGPPNVGKSSLMNALVGYDRSIVFDQPGTTRDVVTASTALDGWPIALSDTAGLREATGDIEQIGVSRAREQAASADLVLAVADAASSDPVDPPLAASWRVLPVVNKIDLRKPASDDSNAVLVSALTGEGIESLIAAIVARLIPTSPLRGEAVPFTERQVRLLDARIALQRNDAAAAMHSLDPM